VNSKSMCLHSDGKGFHSREYSHLSNPWLFFSFHSLSFHLGHIPLSQSEVPKEETRMNLKSLNSLDCFAIAVVRLLHV